MDRQQEGILIWLKKIFKESEVFRFKTTIEISSGRELFDSNKLHYMEL